jgi:hypothetical protein
MLMICWLVDPDEPGKHPLRRAINVAVITFATCGGAFATVRGTVMQLVGVYRNCVCKAGIRFWLNHAGGVVELATDTQFDRDSWIVWWVNGISALGLFFFVLLLTYFYNMWMKENCTTIIAHSTFRQEVECEGKWHTRIYHRDRS